MFGKKKKPRLTQKQINDYVNTITGYNQLGKYIDDLDIARDQEMTLNEDFRILSAKDIFKKENPSK